MRGGGALGCFIPVSAHPWESNNFGRGTLPYCPCLCVFCCVYVRMWGRSGPWVFHPSRSNDAPTPLGPITARLFQPRRPPFLGVHALHPWRTPGQFSVFGPQRCWGPLAHYFESEIVCRSGKSKRSKVERRGNFPLLSHVRSLRFFVCKCKPTKRITRLVGLH